MYALFSKFVSFGYPAVSAAGRFILFQNCKKQDPHSGHAGYTNRHDPANSGTEGTGFKMWVNNIHCPAMAR